MTRVAIVDPQPAMRAGLVALLRGEPGLVPVGAAGDGADALELLARAAPDLVMLEPRVGGGEGVQLCRRIAAGERAPRVVAYTDAPDPGLVLALRVAGADGLVDKLAPPAALFEALRLVAGGGTALPPVTPEQLDAAAQRVESDDLALLAMLVDRTPPGEVADALRLDRRRMTRRVERLLTRLRPRTGTVTAF
ncbi:MAG TPA: response regulator transcription factor [Solirubrobacteraceae bacterium]|nr:response regulator transcription factor [Solirubrobacteraceae bacterium]